MKQIKVSEATGPALDWLAAKCEGLKLLRNALLDGQVKEGWWVSGYYMDPNNWIPLCLLNLSTDWAQGGPIMEREGISIIFHEQGHWTASNLHGTVCGEGPTPLIAAMRCYLASKLGDTVEVPEELG